MSQAWAECPACRWSGVAELVEGEGIECPNCGEEACMSAPAPPTRGEDAAGSGERVVSAEDLLAAQDGVRALLRLVGEDPARSGLEDTPERVCRALLEVTSGYGVDPGEVLARRFSSEECDAPAYDEVILLRGIRFSSTCEHHLLPFAGEAAVAYIPGEGGAVVGLSKLARLVEAYARRLQLQERLTAQVAHALDEHLSPSGVAVVLRARHQCMACRGVVQPDAEMVTSCTLGAFREEPAARAELLALLRGS